MKVSLNWLKDYVVINHPVADVAEILTNTGLEVEEVNEFLSVEGGLEGVKIGEVKSIEKHPDADKLVVTSVNIGNGEELKIICGAPNVAAGQKVVVATVGSTLHHINGEQLKIRKAKIRGVESFGMICAEDEIGIGNGHDGIMVLPDHAVVGQDAKEYFKVEKDWIFEIGLTPNRSDGNSHIGVARDFKAAVNVLFDTKLDLKWPEVSQFKVDNQSLTIPVKVENPTACPRYSGLTISDITVKPSPDWLKNRLKAIGVRAINNIVDATNYILHEYGQPLHAFDADKITGGEIVVKTMPEGSTFVTLDEIKRKLDKEDLMICNKEEGMCIAGVFGGIKSGVTAQTTKIFLESAYFDPTYIRKTSTRHLLRTDAATHFEKGIDPNVTIIALKRAAMLIKELAGGQISSEIIDIYPTPFEDREIQVSVNHVHRLAGTELAEKTIEFILNELDIQVREKAGDVWKVTVPPYRHDVTREADVIEEILRIYGYNNIPLPASLRSNISYTDSIDPLKVVNTISNMLTGKGFSEIMNNSITKSALYAADLKKEETTVYLANNMTAELDMMRTSMLHSGLENIIYNINRKNSRLQLFEYGKTYHRTGTAFKEESHLTLFLAGNHIDENWIEKPRPFDHYYLKGVVENVLSRLGIESYRTSELKNSKISIGARYELEKGILVDYGQVDKNLLQSFDIEAPVFYADFNWDIILDLVAGHKVKFSPISKFPAVRRDLALLIDEGTSFAQIKEIAHQQAKNLLKSVNLFDIYRGKHIEEGKKSYAVSYVFEDIKKTLTDKEVDKLMQRMIAAYQSKLNATIR